MPRTRSESGHISVVVSDNSGAEVVTEWDRLVTATPASDVTQLSAWARVRRAAGFEPLYVLVRHGDQLVAGAQVLQRRVPFLGRLGYTAYGPVIAPETPSRSEVVATLARALHGLGRKRLRMLFVQPPLGTDDVRAELLRLGFRHSTADIAPSASLRLDLSVDEATLRQGLSKKLRWWTNKWETRGVTVRTGTAADVPVLADLLARSAEYQGFEPLSADYIAGLYSILEPTGHALLFVGEVAGVDVAATLFTACGGVLKERLTGLDRTSEASRLSVPSAVKWEAIRWAKSNGYCWYDFGGINKDAAQALSAGAAPDPVTLGGDVYHKTRFGGTLYYYPRPVELISSPVLRLSYDLSRRWSGGRRLISRAQHLLRAGKAKRD
jgi:lipid II:glycine glycyltransferase (peptidoglycan interpeptide bridge formation enzyme)